MTRLKLIIIGAGVVVVAVALIVVLRLTSTGFDRRLNGSAPVGIFFALEDDKNGNAVEIAGQMIILPEQRRVLLLFLNTDAHYEGSDKPVRTALFGEDRFSRFTGVPTHYSIRITRTNAARALDALGGLPFFVEETVTFRDSLYQYPRGLNVLPGEQLLEYAMAREPGPPSDAYLNGIDRLFRIESTVLNLLWKRNHLRDQVSHAKWQAFLVSLVKTDLSAKELIGLFSFLAPEDGVQFNVAEIPLEALPPGAAGPEGRLVVKEKRAQRIFAEYRDNLQSGRLTPEAFPLEVLNGTETNGLGRRVRQFLQDRGLQGLVAENYRYRPLARTVILERAGNTFIAEKLRDLTGVDRNMVFFRRRASDVNATLILGEDFNVKKMNLSAQ